MKQPIDYKKALQYIEEYEKGTKNNILLFKKYSLLFCYSKKYDISWMVYRYK